MATLEDVQAVVEELRALIGQPDEVLAQRISDKPVFVAHLITLRACCNILIESLGTEGLTVVARIIHGPSQTWEGSAPDPPAATGGPHIDMRSVLLPFRS